MVVSLVALVVISGLLLGVLTLASTPFQTVSRERVERFALRQALPITVANGPLVIAYLATTRRWRGTGLLLTVIGCLIVSVPQQRSSVPFIALFVGWFVGAVIAEWRVSAVVAAPGPRRASLTPRGEADYVSRGLRWRTRIAVVLAVGATLAGQAHNGNHLKLAGLTAVVVGAVASAWVVTHRVLTRPQVVTGPDVLAADEAIRSRSLQVLNASVLAVAGVVTVAAVQLSFAAGAVGKPVYRLLDLAWVGVVFYAYLGARSPVRTRSTTVDPATVAAP